MIEIGLNINNKRFPNKLNILQEARNAGVKKFIFTGVDWNSTKNGLNLIQENNLIDCFTTAGFHPHHANELVSSKSFNQQLREILNNDKVVAVGETGLDYDRNYSTPEEQKIALEQQLQLSLEVNKPLFLHLRSNSKVHNLKIAESHILKDFYELVGNNHYKGVVHCFTGSEKMMQSLLNRDFYIGITGWVCDIRRGEELRNAVKYLPLDKMMIETDAPFLTPQNIPNSDRNKTNYPKNLIYIVEKIAEIKKQPIEKIIEQTIINTEKLFNI